MSFIAEGAEEPEVAEACHDCGGPTDGGVIEPTESVSVISDIHWTRLTLAFIAEAAEEAEIAEACHAVAYGW